ncbi:MAG TPA: PAS domain S-box protein [Dissulfurispiraceae bacterium]|nr:PAS domain S-box protein [Dissulfurispiraceae bacterium]
MKDKQAGQVEMASAAEGANNISRRDGMSLWNNLETAHRIWHSIPAGVGISRVRDGVFIEINDFFLDICGYERNEIIGRTSLELGLWGEPQHRRRFIDMVHNDGYAKDVEMKCRQKSGEMRDLLISAKKIHIDGEDCILGILQDNSSRKLAEQALVESEALYKGFFLTSRDSVSIVSADEQIIDFNDATLELLGYDSRDELSKVPTVAHFVNPADMLAGLAKLKQEGYVQDYPLQIRRRDGTVIDTVVTAALLRNPDGSVKARINTIRDVTEKKRSAEQRRMLQAQLFQSQKMEAVGQLAGGIAHDFNNILSAIIGYGYLIQTKLVPDNPLQADLGQILESANRAAEVTHSLLAFSRNQLINPLPWDINALITKSMKLITRLIGEDIEIVLNLTNDDLICLVDEAQMDQVVLNLATNARDAMPDGGSFILSTGIVTLDQNFILTHGYGKPFPYALISITDTGQGMDQETKARLFEPFFTTKPMGKGTGLGLSMVYGIISQLDGHIEVKSEVGKGTTFEIYLPLSPIGKAAVAANNNAEPKGGSETILVAEDDAKLRKLYYTILSKYGYNVILAGNGDDAIMQFIENKDKIKLIVLDMIMPKKSGREAYAAMKEIGTSAEFLFASGYTADRMDKEFLQTEGISYIVKPARPKDLLLRVREILDEMQRNRA